MLVPLISRPRVVSGLEVVSVLGPGRNVNKGIWDEP